MYKPIKYDMTSIKPLKSKNKKNQRYWQTNLKPLGDKDKDNKINLLDCYPYNKNQKGFWHDVKKKVTGDETSDIQQTQQDIEDFEYDDKSGEYTLREKKKKYGEEGYIKEGFQELGHDVGASAKYVGGKVKSGATVVGEKTVQKMDDWAERATRPSEELMGEGQSFGRATQQAGIRQPSENIKEGVQFRRPTQFARTQPRTQPRKFGPPSPPGWWRGNQQQEQQQQIMVTPEGEVLMMQQPRRLPANVQPYAPVSRGQSFLGYKPSGKIYKPPVVHTSQSQSSEHTMNPSRPRGMMVSPKFKFFKPIVVRYGRRTD